MTKKPSHRLNSIKRVFYKLLKLNFVLYYTKTQLDDSHVSDFKIHWA